MRFSLVFLAGCSLGNISPAPCTTSSECRDAFGFGWVCGQEAGFCEALSATNRCATPFPADLFSRPDNHQNKLIIGTLFDYGEDIENLRSIELAISEANTGGGLAGQEFALANCNYAEDISLDADDATTAARALTTWLHEDVGVTVILGPGDSPKVEEIWDLSSAAGLLLIAPSATSDRLITIDGTTSTDADPGLFWRTAPPDVFQADAIASDLVDRAITDVVIIHNVGAYGEGLAAGIDAVLPGTVTITLMPFDNSNQLTAATADAGVAAAPEVIFISSDPTEVAAFLNGAAATGAYTHKGIFLTDSARDVSVLETASNATALFPNLRGSVPVPDPASASTLESTFYSAYSQRYGEPASRDGFNTFSYDAAWLALYGLAWSTTQANSTEGIEVARGLRQIATPGAPSVPIRAASWTEVQTAFAAGTPIDVFGASGTLDYDPTTAETTNPIAIWTVMGTDTFVDERICRPNEGCVPFPI